MKGFSLCDLSSIVQTIFGKCLVYCFKLDNNEFNLKNTSLVFQGFKMICVQFIVVFQMIKFLINIKLMTILTFY